RRWPALDRCPANGRLVPRPSCEPGLDGLAGDVPESLLFASAGELSTGCQALDGPHLQTEPFRGGSDAVHLRHRWSGGSLGWQAPLNDIGGDDPAPPDLDRTWETTGLGKPLDPAVRTPQMLRGLRRGVWFAGHMRPQ